MKLTKNILILIAILLIGLFLRVYKLDSESIYLDEGFTIDTSKYDLKKITEITSHDVHPPLYFFIMHYWINLFGDSEFSTRFLSVIFGTLSIFMIYKVGTLIFDEEVGIISSLILGLSFYHIRYSQQARHYTLLALMTLFSFYFLIKLINKINLKDSIGYVLSSSILMYTHFYSIFIILCQNIFLFTLFLTNQKKNKYLLKPWILFQVILIVLFIPWIQIFLNRTSELVQKGFWIPKPSIESLFITLLEFSGYYKLFGFEISATLFVILAFYSLLTIKNSIHKQDSINVKWIYMLFIWLLVPILTPFVISLVSLPIFTPKYIIAASLALYIMVAKGITNINKKYIKFFIIALIIVISFINITSIYETIKNEQWREVVNYTESNAKSGDLLLFTESYTQKLAYDYYSNRNDLIKKPITLVDYSDNEKNIKKLLSIVSGYDRVWLIKRSNSMDPKGFVQKTLNESYAISYQKDYMFIDLYLFEKKSKIQ